MLTISVLAVAVAFGAPGTGASQTVPEPGQPKTGPRDLNTHHCMTPPNSRALWEGRAGIIRRRILVSAGLWPMPARTPLHPIVTGRTERDDFTVENVAIETIPGFWLCGNLYRPRGGKGPFPAIANPHGHWSHGRLEMQPDVERAAPPPAPGGEGRANLTAIGVNLARQGFVVFAYDMVGYNDTDQVNHQFAGNLDSWFRGVSLMGLQLWNSMRAVDYLCSLRDVDRSRIGVTGASGGGTQTFLLTAVDDRIKASVPVNMVSASMQGGCLCENGPGLRVGTDNVEIAALCAPRPLLLIAATGDWTRNVPTEEWPAIKAVYDLYDAGDRTECRQFNYGHNYNIESREAMYAFFARWLKAPGAPAPPRERPFDLAAAGMRVWSDAARRPPGIASEADLAAAMESRSRDALKAIWPHDRRGLSRFRARMGPALRAALYITEPPPVAKRRAVPAKRAVLVVTEGDVDRDLWIGILEGLKKKDVVPMGMLTVQLAMDPKKEWDGFRSCYNPTEFSGVCRIIAERLREMAADYATVDVIGLGRLGPAALFGQAASGVNGGAVADMSGLDPRDRQAIHARMYAPCLDGLGGVGSAIALVSPSPVVLLGAGDLERWLPGVGFTTAALSVRMCDLNADRIVEALVASRRP